MVQDPLSGWWQPLCSGDCGMTSTSVFFSLGLSFATCKMGRIIPARGLMGGDDKGVGVS